MGERILVADDDPVLRTLIAAVLEAQGFEVLTVASGDALVRTAREALPDLLLIDVMMPVMSGLEAIRLLRNDTRTGHLPMLLITAQATPDQAVAGFESGADDYITKPFNNDLLVARVRANLRRAARMPVNNPLTGLPGNLLIKEEVEYRLGQERPFALLWIDINNFKSFNDAYGFGRGDRVIRLVADLLSTIKHDANDDEFIGHIGGDDFVVIAGAEDATPISKQLIERFDAAIGEFYDAADRTRGYLHGLDRFGTPRRFPILSLAIGIVDTSRRAFSSFDDVSSVAAEVKSFAKKMADSAYAVDERHLVEPVSKERRGQPPLVVIICTTVARCTQFGEAARKVGCRIEYAASGQTAWLDRVPGPDLLVLDTTDANTWLLLKRLRAERSALPVILIAATPDDELRGIEAGAHAALSPQVTTEQISTSVAELLRLNPARLLLDESTSEAKDIL